MQPYFFTTPIPAHAFGPSTGSGSTGSGSTGSGRARVRPTLSLDLDNVIRDQIGSVITAVRRRHGLKLQREMFHCWDPPLGELLGMSNAEFTGWAWADPMIFAEARPLPYAVPALHRLARDYRLVVTTATAWPQLTEPWLKRWNVPYSAVIHTTDKGSVAFDWHVDDSPATLLKLSEAGRPVIRFALPWNEHLDALPGFADWRNVGEIL